MGVRQTHCERSERATENPENGSGRKFYILWIWEFQTGVHYEDNFWDVSRVLLDKIEGPSYIYSKDRHNEYLRNNPFVAKKRCINTFKVDD